MRRIVICDLDGTLSNPIHRRHFVDGSQKKDWDKFYDLCDQDPPHDDVLLLIDILAKQFAIVYVTGRVERVRSKTETWLRRQYAPMGPVFMRPDGDHQQDYVLKYKLAEANGWNKDTVMYAIDDRDQVVDMWRSIGIRCLQVADGAF